MFARPRATALIAPPKKKRKTAPAIEEISFDFSAREDYLTGFHKRKVQRIKHAKDEAAKKDREDKVAARKILREGRKADLEKHVEAVNVILRKQNKEDSESDESENHTDVQQWDGIEEDPVIDREDQYVDEDRMTTVTVEAVEVTRDGLQKIANDSEEHEVLGVGNADGNSNENSKLNGRRPSEKGKRIWTKEPQKGPKKRKKKFHYENKAERKMTRYKEKAGNRKEAKARKA